MHKKMESGDLGLASNGLGMRTEGITRNSTLLCVPIMAESTEKMVINLKKAEAKGADVVEIRLDALKIFNPHEDLKTLIKESPLPTLFTYRPKWEGGEYDGDENERLDVLRLAMKLGADYVDVELQVAQEFIDSIRDEKPKDFKVIVSSHNYKQTPSLEELGSLAATIQACGADIVKIATMGTDITDVARVFQIMVHSQVPIIGLVMGDRGFISRILCPKFGGFLTFGTLEKAMVSAPGQPTIDDLINIFNVRQIGPDTKVFGLMGNPVGHSKAPVLYNKLFKTVGFNGVYVPLLVDDSVDFLDTYSSTDFVGFSITIPLKEVVLKYCDEVDPVAKSIGAINLIIRRQTDGKLCAYNTDYYGAISAIEDGLRELHKNRSTAGSSPLAGKLVVVMGAGGTSKAVAYGAKQKGARIVIANRTYDRARELANDIGGEAISLADLENFHPEDGMILANTTSVGMVPKADQTPIPKAALKHYSLVFDAVYTPKMTRLLREAEECGVAIVTGFELFIIQAYEQYEKFTGLPAPKQLFREVMADY